MVVKLFTNSLLIFVLFSHINCALSNRGEDLTIKDNSVEIETADVNQQQQTAIFTQKGKASYMADELHGKQTAGGELFDMRSLTAAHKHLPFGTIVRVTNLANLRTVDVRINDRGPFVKDRIIDVSFEAAKQLDFIKEGIAEVKLEVIKLGQ